MCECVRVWVWVRARGQLLHRSVRATAHLPRLSVPAVTYKHEVCRSGGRRERRCSSCGAGWDHSQAIAVLRNIARETSQRKVGHKIRKVIRQEAAKWAGLGTPESDARIAEMERTIAERGGVCVVKSDEEIARLMAEREAQLDSS